MSEQRLLDALGQVNDQFIAEAAPGQREIKPALWKKWLSRAACLAVVIGIVWFAWSRGMPIPGLPTKYQRISFNSVTLCGDTAQIDPNAAIINHSDVVFPEVLPKYKITKRPITDKEFQIMLQNLGIGSDVFFMEHKGNSVFIRLANYTSDGRQYFDELNYTDEELETLAWDIFNKLPFMEGEYEYLGFRTSTTLGDSEGEHIVSAVASFRRRLYNIGIAGNDVCNIYFDGSGFLGLKVVLYQYQQVGTMKLMPLDKAIERLKKPDYFSLDGGTVSRMDVEKIRLTWVNQYSDGCTILQPVYYFDGTATLGLDKELAFSARVIAIPEFYTYKKIRFRH